MHTQVHFVLSANDDAVIRSLLIVSGGGQSFGNTLINLHTAPAAPCMQHSSHHTLCCNVCRLVHAVAEGLWVGPTAAATWPGMPCNFSIFKLHFWCRVLKAQKPALSIVGIRGYCKQKLASMGIYTITTTAK